MLLTASATELSYPSSFPHAHARSGLGHADASDLLRLKNLRPNTRTHLGLCRSQMQPVGASSEIRQDGRAERALPSHSSRVRLASALQLSLPAGEALYPSVWSFPCVLVETLHHQNHSAV